MASNVTLKDVARRADVSYQTVSKVLRNQMQVTPETRARIMTAVEELGYRPNVAARSLRTQSTRLIGYSWKPPIHNETNPVLEEFLYSTVAAAEQAGYELLLFPYYDDESWTSSYTELSLTNRVDGFVLSDLNYDDPRIDLLHELGVPFVAFGRSNGNNDFPYVDVDNRAGLRLATEHLLAQGHQRIALLGWPEGSRVGSSRLNGYREAMEQAGQAVDPDLVVRTKGRFENGYQVTQQLLDLPADRRPTAIAAVVDILAIAAMRAVQDRGLRVGSDIAVTGYDDTPLIQYLNPGLTSVRQPIAAIGTAVVHLLLDLLEKDQPGSPQQLLEPELVVRGSSTGEETFPYKR